MRERIAIRGDKGDEGAEDAGEGDEVRGGVGGEELGTKKRITWQWGKENVGCEGFPSRGERHRKRAPPVGTSLRPRRRRVSVIYCSVRNCKL
jgi:hypothetical protein